MNIEVITSFNQRYYDLIGKDCVDSFLELWPSNIKLTCYVEGFFLDKSKKIKQISFDELPEDYFSFQDDPKFKNRTKIFSKKAYSFIHAMYNSKSDRIIWLDADVITHKKIDFSFFEKIFPNDSLNTFMGVTYTEDGDGNPGEWFVPETGFFGINTQHQQFKEFRNEYHRHYKEKDFLNLRRTYDNDVYGSVIRKIKCNNVDLCLDFTKPYKTPMKHCILGDYLHHYKAKAAKINYINED